jgi:MoxR-like ATPase
MVICTENIFGEEEGTFPNPGACDRAFYLRQRPDVRVRPAIPGTAHPKHTAARRVQGRAARTVKEYIRVGISPRVNFHLEAVARTFAFFTGDTKITPDHIKAVAPHVLAHRLVLREGMEFSVSREEVLAQVIRDMEVPPWK